VTLAPTPPSERDPAIDALRGAALFGVLLENLQHFARPSYAQLVASGTPVTRYVEMQSNVPVLYLGRGSDGRTPTLSQTDLSLRQEFRLGELTLELVADLLNLFHQETVTSVFSAETRDIIAISNDDFFAGFDVQGLVEAQKTRRDPRFLQADGFQAPRTVRLLARLNF